MKNDLQPGLSDTTRYHKTALLRLRKEQNKEEPQQKYRIETVDGKTVGA